MNRDERRLRQLHQLLARVASGETTALPTGDANRTLTQIRDEIDGLVFRINAGMVCPLPRIEVVIPGVADGR